MGRRGKDYFDDLLERIREIRASERRFYQKITDIYALSADYDRNAPITEAFFASGRMRNTSPILIGGPSGLREANEQNSIRNVIWPNGISTGNSKTGLVVD